jgi:hypothetical protein
MGGDELAGGCLGEMEQVSSHELEAEATKTQTSNLSLTIAFCSSLSVTAGGGGREEGGKGRKGDCNCFIWQRNKAR